MTQDRLSSLLDELIVHSGVDHTPHILDKIKAFGFKYSTVSGTTWGFGNVSLSPENQKLSPRAERWKNKLFQNGAKVSCRKKKNIQKIVELWTLIKKNFGKGFAKHSRQKMVSAYDLFTSKARGNMSTLSQMTGMIGLIQNNQARSWNTRSSLLITKDFPD